MKIGTINLATALRHKVRFQVCLLLLIFSSTTSAQMARALDEMEYCTPYSLLNQKEEGPSQILFPYDLRVNDVKGRKEIVVTAPTLRVTGEQLGTLLRAPGLADSSIAKIRLDAREIVIAEGIALEAGQLELVADRIIFLEGGTLSIRPDSDSYVAISARIVSFPAIVFRHFDVRQRVPAPGKPEEEDTFSDIKSLLTLKAETLAFGNQATDSLTAPGSLQKRFSLDGLVDFKSKIMVETGAKGAESVALENINARWPEIVLSSWLETFNTAPFSISLRRDVERLVRDDSQYVATFLKPSSAFLLKALRNAIARGTDLNGNGPAFAPASTLAIYREELEKYYKSDSKAPQLQLPDLLTALKNLADDMAKLPETQLNEVAKKLDSLTRTINSDDNELVRLGASIEGLGQRSLQIQVEYEQRVVVLKQNAAAKKASTRNRAEIVSLLSTATALGTTAYTGNPQAGAAAGGVVNAIGNSGNGRTALESINQGYKFAKRIQGSLGETKGALEGLTKARDKYKVFVRPGSTFANATIEESAVIDGKTVLKEEAIKNFGDSLAGFANTVGGLVDVYKEFKDPSDETGSAEFEEDDDLRKVGAELAYVLGEVKTGARNMEVVQRRLVDQQTQFLQLAEQISAYKKIDVNNTGDQRRLGELIVASIKDEMSRFVKIARNLMSLHQLEFGIPLAVDPKALLSLTLAQTFKKDLFDAGTAYSDRDALHQLHKVGLARNEELKALAGRMVEQSVSQVKTYIQVRGQPPVDYSPAEDIRDSENSPLAERLFLRSVNASLDEQFKIVRSSISLDEKKKKLKEITARRHPIPFNIKDRVALSSFPQRLVQAKVSSVEVKQETIGGTGLDFFIDVERAGNLRTVRSEGGTREEVCAFVDLRDKSTPHDAFFRVSSSTLDDIKSGRSFVFNPPSLSHLTNDTPPPYGSILFNYQPAEARKYLRVVLDPDAAWRGAPTISLLTIKYQIFQ
jgi:hypothetical protein